MQGAPTEDIRDKLPESLPAPGGRTGFALRKWYGERYAKNLKYQDENNTVADMRRKMMLAARKTNKETVKKVYDLQKTYDRMRKQA